MPEIWLRPCEEGEQSPTLCRHLCAHCCPVLPGIFFATEDHLCSTQAWLGTAAVLTKHACLARFPGAGASPGLGRRQGVLCSPVSKLCLPLCQKVVLFWCPRASLDWPAIDMCWHRHPESFACTRNSGQRCILWVAAGLRVPFLV